MNTEQRNALADRIDAADARAENAILGLRIRLQNANVPDAGDGPSEAERAVVDELRAAAADLRTTTYSEQRDAAVAEGGATDREFIDPTSAE